MPEDFFTVALDIPRHILARVETICSKRKLSLSDIFLDFVEKHMPHVQQADTETEDAQTEFSKNTEEHDDRRPA